jgi:hypothetical protein
MQILEDALVLCKFGKFHIRLMLTTLAASCAAMMVTTTTSYVLPNAECDLDMTMVEKGLLTSMPFFGNLFYYFEMITVQLLISAQHSRFIPEGVAETT